MQDPRNAPEFPGKPGWRDLLLYVHSLHQRSTHPAVPPFADAWEEIGPGYCYGPAFGHWDIVHACLDALQTDPEHARRQLENLLSLQRDDGFLPAAVRWQDGQPVWGAAQGHPPVWIMAVRGYLDGGGSEDILRVAWPALTRQLQWFEANRQAEPEGFFYTDILNHVWESGVDEGIRFLETRPGRFACVDATAHVFAMYEHAARWAGQLGAPADEINGLQDKAETLRSFIQTALFAPETGFFHDIWSVRDPALRCLAFEGSWPVVVGAATPEQAHRVIHENLLNPERFFTKHPLATVAVSDPRFELRMWRGPAWNSMTCWAARGCLRYGEPQAAHAILEAALDASAAQFARTGTIWEFYHPHGGHPEDVRRKPQTKFNLPCRDYLGHNPLIAMAAMTVKLED